MYLDAVEGLVRKTHLYSQKYTHKPKKQEAEAGPSPGSSELLFPITPLQYQVGFGAKNFRLIKQLSMSRPSPGKVPGIPENVQQRISPAVPAPAIPRIFPNNSKKICPAARAIPSRPKNHPRVESTTA